VLALHRKDGSERTCIILFQNVKGTFVKITTTDELVMVEAGYYLDKNKAGPGHLLFSLSQC